MIEERAARAALLAKDAVAAREPLLFASAMLAAQSKCADRLSDERHQPSGHLADDIGKILPSLRPMLETAAKRGPQPLADEAQRRLEEDEATATTRLLTYWKADITAREDYLSRALLQPYAEILRQLNRTPDRVHARGHCPFCGGAAWISARKSAPDAESGFRHLGCSLCGLEWNFNRICCPSCFEEDPYKLPLFQSDLHPLVRIEACDTCRRYVKSIDLTKDARPIPAVDDLVSLSMDLWAVDEGYTRIEPGLAGL